MLWLLPLLLPVIMFPHPDSHNKIDFVRFAFTFIILFVRSLVDAILIIILTNVLEKLRYNTGRGWGLVQCLGEENLPQDQSCVSYTGIFFIIVNVSIISLPRAKLHRCRYFGSNDVGNCLSNF